MFQFRWRRPGRWRAAVAAVIALGGVCAPQISLADPAPAAAKPADAAPAAPLSVDDFFKDPAFSAATLSPDGHRVALSNVAGDQRTVAIVDLVKGGTKPILTTDDKNFSVDWIVWKTDSRLIVGTSYLKFFRIGGKPDGEIYDFAYNRMIIAVDDTGAHQVTLMKSDKATAKHSGNVVGLLDVLRKDPGHLLATADDRSGRTTIWRVDVGTGSAEPIEKATDHTFGWVTDIDGAVVARLELRGSNLVIEGRPPGGTEWREVARIRAKDFDKELADFEILGPGEQPGSLLVAVKPKDPAEGKSRSIHIYDMKTHSLGPAVWPAMDYDIADVVQDPVTRRLEGVCYWVDIYTCDFKDKEVQRHLRAISKYFKDQRDLAPTSISNDGRFWLLNVSGPNETSTYYYYDWTKHQISPLVARFPALPSDRLGTMERYVYEASDGMKIPAYLTRPPNAPPGPLPLVVMPHGGPEARDTYDFDKTSQVLATRGYMVFQPNFRGSGGYGVAYAEAGYREWGGRMQADITDGVRRLIAEGKADPNRICIVGASYGGYAALIGGAQNPDLYKCVVDWAGVSDLVKMLKWERGQGGGEKSERFQYWQKSIGDPEDDKARLTNASPLTYAKTYQPPVLMIHGSSDDVVPIDQSRIMEAALKAAGKTVSLKVYKGEGHSAWEDKNEKAALSEIIAFLAQYIPPAPGR